MLRIETRVPFTKEKSRVQPALILRPHHFSMDVVQYAFLGLRNSQKAATEFTEHLARPETLDPAYETDLFGSRKDFEILRFQEGMEEVLVAAEKLPGRSLVKFDLEPDPVCGGCKIGRHCSATNFKLETTIRNVEAGEESKVAEIVQDLQELGYKRGTHFIREQTKHILYDFGERDINGFAQAEPKTVVFNGLLVFTYALRDVAAKRLKYPTTAEIRAKIWEWSSEHSGLG